MSNLQSIGFWTCTAIYLAIGVIGVVLFSLQPNIASATDGYGTIRIATQN